MRIVPEAQLVRLTPRVSWLEARIAQPLAIAVQCSRQARLKAHQDVMVLGGGCIGLLLGAMAKAYVLLVSGTIFVLNPWALH
jgi:threonine dehydrogenase-like Zn-dependent dehydrogenase